MQLVNGRKITMPEELIYVSIQSVIKNLMQSRGYRCFTKHKWYTGRQKSRQMPFFCPWWPLPLTFKLVRNPNEGPNTSSVWICRKSIQQLPGYFIHKQKSHRQRQTQNLTQFTACGIKHFQCTPRAPKPMLLQFLCNKTIIFLHDITHILAYARRHTTAH